MKTGGNCFFTFPGAQFDLFKLLASTIVVILLAIIPLQSQAATKSRIAKVAQDHPVMERLVLMPLRLDAEDQKLQGAMEIALIDGLQQKYEVFSGEQVASKVREIFNKESRNIAHKECDETRCLQNIGEYFQAELLASAIVTKDSAGYFLALNIRNIFDDKNVYSKSLPCKGCDAYAIVDKLKELVGVPFKTVTQIHIENLKSETSVAELQATRTVPQPGNVIKDCEYCPEMVMIPAGSFNMGSQNSEAGRYADEGPVHRVNINAFLMGKTHISRGQFAAFVNETQYDAGNICYVLEDGTSKSRNERNWLNPGYPQQDNHPVSCINWNDAKAYADWLTSKTGKRFRIPSEAEWEYAARAGTTTARYWGESQELACAYANVGDQSLKSQLAGITGEKHNCDDGFVYTAPVGSFKPNAFGLYDMQGNLWQWVADHYRHSYNGAPTDGSEWQSDYEKRVVRGGSWVDGPQVVRSAERLIPDTAYRNGGIGFRVARSLP